MIVTCERCDTRFQLDDLRVPATGTRVRCSRCKHVFLLMPTDASPAERVHALAEAALRAPDSTPPSVTRDLPAPPASEEPEWQFVDTQPPAPARPATETPGSDPWDGILDEEKPPEARELDTLGSPEGWTFVSEEAPPLQPSRPAAPASRRPRLPARRVAEAAAEVVPVRSRAFELAGWTTTTVLLLAIVHGIDWTGAPPPLAARVALESGLVVEDLSVRWVESRVRGPLLVVGGEVVNPAAAPTGAPAHLTVRVVGPMGEGQANASDPRPLDALRDPPPGAPSSVPLRITPLAPGARVAFEAAVEGPPAAQSRLELRLAPASDAPIRGGSEERASAAR